MRVKLTPAVLLLMAMAARCDAAARGQAQQNVSPAPANARPATANYSETDVGVSFYQALTSPSTAMGYQQTPVNSLGGMVEVRHLVSPLIGFEVTYSFNQADESFAPTSCTPTSCYPGKQSLTSKASIVGLVWVFSKQFGRLRPFAVGGLGFFIDYPGVTLYANNDVVRPTYIYGGGVDLALTSRIGVRAQFRGNIYTAPDLSNLYPALGTFTHTYQPMGGIFYRF